MVQQMWMMKLRMLLKSFQQREMNMSGFQLMRAASDRVPWPSPLAIGLAPVVPRTSTDGHHSTAATARPASLAHLHVAHIKL
eukprot:4224711-Pyramimonas_sp.AAC.1